jgi:phosphate transport system protein
MERRFHEELTKLKSDILTMAALVETAIHRSTDALRTRDGAMAHSVIEDDRKIDELELAINRRAVDMLALKQPMARDLRFITTAMKINAELERIADLSVNISQRVLDLAGQELLKPLVDIPRLSNLAQKMVKGAIDAFVSQDEKTAKEIILADSEADKLRNSVSDELINDFIVKDGRCAPRAIPLILVARHLERICDHATYIAEEVIYLAQAKVVKHHPEELASNKKRKSRKHH